MREGWHAGPNFHFGHFQRGYCWTRNNRDVYEYIALWVGRIAREAAVPRADWDEYWTWLEQERIACPDDRAEFDHHFTHSNRPNAVPRPGLWLSRRWPLEVAERGGEERLQSEVRQALDDALAALRGSAPHAR